MSQLYTITLRRGSFYLLLIQEDSSKLMFVFGTLSCLFMVIDINKIECQTKNIDVEESTSKEKLHYPLSLTLLYIAVTSLPDPQMTITIVNKTYFSAIFQAEHIRYYMILYNIYH